MDETRKQRSTVACTDFDPALLIVDDDATFRDRLARAMERRGFAVTSVGSVAEGIDAARRTPPTYAILDLRLNDGIGLDIVTVIREVRPTSRIVILTGYANMATAVAAMEASAVDYLAKPMDADAIESALLS